MKLVCTKPGSEQPGWWCAPDLASLTMRTAVTLPAPLPPPNSVMTASSCASHSSHAQEHCTAINKQTPRLRAIRV